MGSFMPLVLVMGFLALLIGMIFVVVAVFLYDMKLLRRQKKALVSKRRSRKKITLIIYAHNHAPTITACLEAVYGMNLRGADISVVDNNSTDGTAKLIRSFQKQHPSFKFSTLYKKQTNQKSEAIKQVLKKSSKKGPVLLIDASVCLDRNSLEEIQAIKAGSNHDPIYLESIPRIEPSYLLISDAYWALSKYLVTKAAAYIRPKTPAASGLAIYYPTAAAAQLQKIPKSGEQTYLSQVKYIQNPLANQESIMERVVIVILSLVAGYLLYLALNKQVVLPLFYFLALFTSWICIVIFSVPGFTRRERSLLSCAVFIAYPLIIVCSFLNLSAGILRLKAK